MTNNLELESMPRKAVSVLVVFASALSIILVVANLMAMKIWDLFGIPVDAGILLFPISYVLGDLLMEIFGYKMANRVAVYSSVFGAMTGIALFLANLLPSYPGVDNSAFDASYGMVGRIFLASLLAFLASQLTNNLIFEKIRQKTKEKQLIRRILLSSCVAHLVDSLVFETIAFYGRLPLGEFITQAVFAYVAGLLLEAILLPVTKRLANRLVKRLQFRHGEITSTKLS